MNRDQAESALAIIRKVIQDTHEDLIAHNWGLIWMIHAFTNASGMIAIGTLIEARNLPILWYLVPLFANAVVNLVFVLLLSERERGIRSYIELQLHGIWITFILFTSAATLMLHAAGAQPRLFCPLMAMTSGIGFAMMGVVFYRRFLAYAAVFMVVMLASPFLPDHQWFALAGAVWVSLFVPGLIMHRERRRRLEAGAPTKVL